MTRNAISVVLFLAGLLLCVLGFAALSSGGGESLCDMVGSSLAKVFAGRCGGISVVGGWLLLLAGGVSMFASNRLQGRE